MRCAVSPSSSLARMTARHTLQSLHRPAPTSTACDGFDAWTLGGKRSAGATGPVGRDGAVAPLRCSVGSVFECPRSSRAGRFLRIIVRQRPRPAIGAFQRDAARGSGSWRSQWQLSLADFRGVGTAWRLGNAGPFGYSALWRRTRAEAVAGPRVVCPARQSLSLISLPRSPQGAECLLPALLAAV